MAAVQAVGMIQWQRMGITRVSFFFHLLICPLNNVVSDPDPDPHSCGHRRYIVSCPDQCTQLRNKRSGSCVHWVRAREYFPRTTSFSPSINAVRRNTLMSSARYVRNNITLMIRDVILARLKRGMCHPLYFFALIPHHTA